MEFAQFDGAERLSEEMSSAWISFARTGNPNNSALTEQWLPYKAGDEHTYVFDKTSECRGNYDRQLQDFLLNRCPADIHPFD